jgi:DNA-binding protein H-NS
MSIDALLTLRDDVGAALSEQAESLRRQLASLTGAAPRGRPPGKAPAAAAKRRSKLAGRKVAPKYRDKAGNIWSGRGAQPRWMTAAMKGGAKRDECLIAKPARTVRRKSKR